MSTRDVPMNYKSKFILPYRTENEITEELVDETKDIVNFKRSEINNSSIIGNPTVPYNPIYEPTNLIQYAVDRAGITKKNNQNVIENVIENVTIQFF